MDRGVVRLLVVSCWAPCDWLLSHPGGIILQVASPETGTSAGWPCLTLCSWTDYRFFLEILEKWSIGLYTSRAQNFSEAWSVRGRAKCVRAWSDNYRGAAKYRNGKWEGKDFWEIQSSLLSEKNRGEANSLMRIMVCVDRWACWDRVRRCSSSQGEHSTGSW